MTDEQTPQSPEQAVDPQAAQQGATFQLQKLYLKDVSFEAPGAPDIFREPGQPDISMNLAQNVANLGEDAYEVVLTVTVTCKLGDKTAYLAEIKQAGVFNIGGFEAPQHALMVGAYCPNVLFPYARQVISDMVAHGGFQPLVLQPINFEQLYAAQMQQRAAQAQAAAAQNPEAGNA